MREEMKELALNVPHEFSKKMAKTTPYMQTKFMLLFFGNICLAFSLTSQVSLTCKSEFLREIKKIFKKRKEEEEGIRLYEARVLWLACPY